MLLYAGKNDPDPWTHAALHHVPVHGIRQDPEWRRGQEPPEGRVLQHTVYNLVVKGRIYAIVGVPTAGRGVS